MKIRRVQKTYTRAIIKTKFKQKSYIKANIQNQINLVDNFDRGSLLKTSKPFQVDIISFFVTCNPSLPNIK